LDKRKADECKYDYNWWNDCFHDEEFQKNLATLSRLFATKCEWQIQVPETPSAFHPAHNEPRSVAAMRVRNPDCSSAGINR